MLWLDFLPLQDHRDRTFRWAVEYHCGRLRHPRPSGRSLDTSIIFSRTGSGYVSIIFTSPFPVSHLSRLAKTIKSSWIDLTIFSFLRSVSRQCVYILICNLAVRFSSASLVRIALLTPIFLACLHVVHVFSLCQCHSPLLSLLLDVALLGSLVVGPCIRPFLTVLSGLLAGLVSIAFRFVPAGTMLDDSFEGL